MNLRHILIPVIAVIVTWLGTASAMAKDQWSHLIAAAIHEVQGSIPGSTYIKFPTTQRRKTIEGGGYLLMPPDYVEGQPPVPVMFILHGSGGILEEREVAYARELNSIGVAAFLLDTYTPRGIIETIENQRLISNKDFVHDAFAALLQLTKDPRLDTNRSGIMGFSRGGMIAMQTALLEKRNDHHIGRYYSFKAHYPFYPSCHIHYFNNKTTGMPITFFLGEKDDYTGITQCIELENELKAAGGNVTSIIYPDATHAWDTNEDWNYPNAEIHMNCRFQEQADGSWNEITSGISGIIDFTDELYLKALKSCRTYGAVMKANAAVRAKGIETLKELVRKQMIEYQSPQAAPQAAPVMPESSQQ